MEGKFLSGKASGQGDAFFLCKTVFNCRNQSQFLSDAYGIGASRLGEECARRLSFCPESQPADHAHSKITKLRKHSETFSGSSQRTERGRPSWSGSRAGAAKFQIRPAVARRVSLSSPARVPIRLRSAPRILVYGGNVRHTSQT